jgi:hypothetical protein
MSAMDELLKQFKAIGGTYIMKTTNKTPSQESVTFIPNL